MPGDYLAGANITGFERVAEAMLAHGVIRPRCPTPGRAQDRPVRAPDGVEHSRVMPAGGTTRCRMRVIAHSHEAPIRSS